MKRILTCALLAILAQGALAQQTKNAVGGYGTALAEITTINGKVALNVGGHGGVLINHKWLLGASGNNIFFEQKETAGYRDFQFAYYGLFTEYRIKPSANVHLALGLTAGGGMLQHKIYDGSANGNKEDNWVKDGHWTHVIHPTLAMNIKLLSFMQARVHAGYRFTGNTEGAYYKASNLNGWAAGAGLAFGKF